MEPQEASPLCFYLMVHWLQLGLISQACFTTRRQALQSTGHDHILAAPWSLIHSQGSCQLARKVGACGLHFPLIHPFLCSIAAFVASFWSSHTHLCPSAAVIAYLPWIQSLLSHLPNSIPITDPSPVDIGWWGDASTSFGIGVVIQKHWAVWHWAAGFKVGPKWDFDIGWAEATAVELGLHLALHLSIYNTVCISPSAN